MHMAKTRWQKCRDQASLAIKVDSSTKRQTVEIHMAFCGVPTAARELCEICRALQCRHIVGTWQVIIRRTDQLDQFIVGLCATYGLRCFRERVADMEHRSRNHHFGGVIAESSFATD